MAVLPNLWARCRQRGLVFGASTLLLATIPLGSASAQGGGGQSSAGSGLAAPGGGRQVGARIDFPWPIKTREHVDLWLHGFAMLEDDTARFARFRRGYQDDVAFEKNKARILTKLDDNHDQLRARFALNPALYDAEFIALDVETLNELWQGIAVFLKTGPRKTDDSAGVRERLLIAHLTKDFPTAQDKAWLEMFVESLQDEETRWYHDYWKTQQRQRLASLAAIDSLWHRDRPKLQRFLNNTQQQTGDIVLAMPLGGAGRTEQLGSQALIIALPFPESPSDAAVPIYVFAHETVGAVLPSAIATSVSIKVQGDTAVLQQYADLGAVQGGYLLLQRSIPELADGYCRFYLAAARVPVPATAAPASLPPMLAHTYPLPDRIHSAIAQQLDVVISGGL